MFYEFCQESILLSSPSCSFNLYFNFGSSENSSSFYHVVCCSIKLRGICFVLGGLQPPIRLLKRIPAVINLFASLFLKIYANLLPLYGRQNSRFVFTRWKVWFVFLIVSFQERFSAACLTLRAKA